MSGISGALGRVRQRGLWSTCRRIADRMRWRLTEMRLGVRTDGSIAAEELGHDDTQHFGYQPIDPKSLKRALDLVKPSGADVFVDIGCGMGRAVLVAAQYPFQRVLGVEFSKPLYVAAMRNANRVAAALKREIQIVRADATRWSFPPDVTVVFLFNPFQGDSLQRMLDNLKQSIEQAPREVCIIYSLPNCDRDLLRETPWLQTFADVETENRDWERLTIYRVRVEQFAGLRKRTAAGAGARR